MLRPVIEVGLARGNGADKLVQITNWTTEVQANLAGKAPK